MRYDLVIVGGGLVGAGLAAALRPANLQIALVDARLPSNDDPRLFALNAGSCQFLKNVGIWSQLASHAAPIYQVHVSNQGHFGSVKLHREEVDLPELGNVIPAHYIETSLNDLLLTLPNVTLFRPAKLKSIVQQDGMATLRIETDAGEQVLQTAIVIGADGTDSTVRKEVNIKADITEYSQSALVTRTGLSRSHHQIAYERFVPQGAIAMLPLIGNECATIWSGESDVITALAALSEDAFLQRLQTEFGYRLGRLQKTGKRHVFPLRMVRAEKMVEQCVFLLGNSAHTLHPIAAQGFNLALFEVATLVEGILQKVANHEAFTAADLHTISENVQKQQEKSIGLSHRLTQLFSHESALVSIGLQLGMVAFDVATPIKRRFIEGIMGRVGHVPSLLLS